jgi:hypothetical protein
MTVSDFGENYPLHEEYRHRPSGHCPTHGLPREARNYTPDLAGRMTVLYDTCILCAWKDVTPAVWSERGWSTGLALPGAYATLLLRDFNRLYPRRPTLPLEHATALMQSKLEAVDSHVAPPFWALTDPSLEVLAILNPHLPGVVGVRAAIRAADPHSLLATDPL